MYGIYIIKLKSDKTQYDCKWTRNLNGDWVCKIVRKETVDKLLAA